MERSETRCEEQETNASLFSFSQTPCLSFFFLLKRRAPFPAFTFSSLLKPQAPLSI